MRCVQAVYRMVLKYFLDIDCTWNQIDAMAKAVPGKGTWTFPLNTAVTKLGIRATNIEITDYTQLYKKGVGYLHEVNGEKSAAYYIEKSNIASVIPYIPEFLNTVTHLSRKGTIDDILQALREGKLVCAEVNASILNHSDGHSLHSILLYDTDDKNITFHDPGLPPKPGRTVSIEKFMNSFAYPGAGQEIDIFEKS